eukprot:TRINITY_DN40517_c0_g1_i1.p1 TRINITY_DN40517_c0_g1~~TRINITY_DN40517_c0_g1_i1.p1  ORF type:complete len:378 (-),score=43.04 TRINITY_DN40517_c0_g1_i1:172-1305(-)
MFSVSVASLRRALPQLSAAAVSSRSSPSTWSALLVTSGNTGRMWFSDDAAAGSDGFIGPEDVLDFHFREDNPIPETPRKIQRTFIPGQSKRIGLLGRKAGMFHAYDGHGEELPITLIVFEDSQVVQVKTEEGDGYCSVQVGCTNVPDWRKTKPERVHFQKWNAPTKRRVQEFRCTPDALLDPGTVLSARHFVAGQLIDVCGISRGKGFAGVMKRHGFRGGRASHGTSLAHRTHGSTGQNQSPGKVFKGKKMAGHMGSTRVTIHNLRIWKVDVETNAILVKGHVPGAAGNYVRVTDAVTRQQQWGEAPYLPGKLPPFPTFYEGMGEDDVIDEAGMITSPLGPNPFEGWLEHKKHSPPLAKLLRAAGLADHKSGLKPQQ